MALEEPAAEMGYTQVKTREEEELRPRQARRALCAPLRVTPRPGLTALRGRDTDGRAFSPLTLVGRRDPRDRPAESRREDAPALSFPGSRRGSPGLALTQNKVPLSQEGHCRGHAVRVLNYQILTKLSCLSKRRVVVRKVHTLGMKDRIMKSTKCPFTPVAPCLSETVVSSV